MDQKTAADRLAVLAPAFERLQRAVEAIEPGLKVIAMMKANGATTANLASTAGAFSEVYQALQEAKTVRS